MGKRRWGKRVGVGGPLYGDDLGLSPSHKVGGTNPSSHVGGWAPPTPTPGATPVPINNIGDMFPLPGVSLPSLGSTRGFTPAPASTPSAKETGARTRLPDTGTPTPGPVYGEDDSRAQGNGKVGPDFSNLAGATDPKASRVFVGYDPSSGYAKYAKMEDTPYGPQISENDIYLDRTELSPDVALDRRAKEAAIAKATAGGGGGGASAPFSIWVAPDGTAYPFNATTGALGDPLNSPGNKFTTQVDKNGNVWSFEFDPSGKPTGEKKLLLRGKAGIQFFDTDDAVYAYQTDPETGEPVGDPKPIIQKKQKPLLQSTGDGGYRLIDPMTGNVIKEVKGTPKITHGTYSLSIPEGMAVPDIQYQEPAAWKGWKVGEGRRVGSGQDVGVGAAWAFDDFDPDQGFDNVTNEYGQHTGGPRGVRMRYPMWNHEPESERMKRKVGWGQAAPLNDTQIPPAASQGDGGWVPPVSPDRVEGIGNRFGEPVSMEGTHKGTDIQAVEGTPVVAPFDGRITNVQYDPQGLGLKVTIQDEMTGEKVVLSHMAMENVDIGQEVKAGQPIGKVGSTGAGSTGPHLDVRDQTPDGQYMNPEPKLPPEIRGMPLSPNTVGGPNDPRMGMMGTGQDRYRGWGNRVGVGAVYEESPGVWRNTDNQSYGSVGAAFTNEVDARSYGNTGGGGGGGGRGRATEVIDPGYKYGVDTQAATERARLDQAYELAQQQLASNRYDVDKQYQAAAERLAQEYRVHGDTLQYQRETRDLQLQYQRETRDLDNQQKELDRQFQASQSEIQRTWQSREAEVGFNRQMAASSPWLSSYLAGRSPKGVPSGWATQASSGPSTVGQQMSTSGTMPGQVGSQQPSYRDFAAMDPYQKSAYRYQTELSGTPWGQTAMGLRNAWGAQGITDIPGMTPLQSAGLNEEGMANQNMLADTFGYTPEDYWNKQKKGWAASAATNVIQRA